MTFAKSNDHFTTCFGGQVYQVLYLCSKEPRATSATFPAMDRVLFISKLEPYHARGMLRKNHQKTKSELQVLLREKFTSSSTILFSSMSSPAAPSFMNLPKDPKRVHQGLERKNELKKSAATHRTEVGDAGGNRNGVGAWEGFL